MVLSSTSNAATELKAGQNFKAPEAGAFITNVDLEIMLLREKMLVDAKQKWFACENELEKTKPLPTFFQSRVGRYVIFGSGVLLGGAVGYAIAK